MSLFLNNDYFVWLSDNIPFDFIKSVGISMKKKEIEIPQIKIFIILRISIIPNLSFDFNLKSKDLTNHNKREYLFCTIIITY